MIRERVDIRGHTRPMEPKEELEVLKIPREQIGLIKEDPTLRWLKGQTEWDHTYRRAAKKAVKKREKLKFRAQRMLDSAREQGLITVDHPQLPDAANKGASYDRGHSGADASTNGIIQEDRRWGPLDLEDENPPPTAIAKRRDTVRACYSVRLHFLPDSTHRGKLWRCSRRVFTILHLQLTRLFPS